MVITWTRGQKLPDGSRQKVPAYTCNHRTTKATCNAPAYVHQVALDTYIDGFMEHILASNDVVAEAFAAADRLEEAQINLADAEHRLAELLAFDYASAGLTLAAHAAMVAAAEGSVAMREGEVANARNASTNAERFNGSLRETWPMLGVEAKREILHGVIGEIRVMPNRGKRGVLVANRVTLIDRTGTLLDHSEDFRRDDRVIIEA